MHDVRAKSQRSRRATNVCTSIAEAVGLKVVNSGCRERNRRGELQGSSGHWVLGWVLSPLQVQLCTDISYKGELKTTDGKIPTTLLIPLSLQLLLWKAQKHQVLSWNGGLLMGTMKTFRVRHTKPLLPSRSPFVPKVSCTKKQEDLCATIMLLVAAPTVGQVHLLGKGWSPLSQSGFPGRDRWQNVEWNCLSSSTSVRRQRTNILLLPFHHKTVTPSWKRKVEHKPQVNPNNQEDWKSGYGQHLQSTGLLY